MFFVLFYLEESPYSRLPIRLLIAVCATVHDSAKPLLTFQARFLSSSTFFLYFSFQNYSITLSSNLQITLRIHPLFNSLSLYNFYICIHIYFMRKVCIDKKFVLRVRAIRESFVGNIFKIVSCSFFSIGFCRNFG